MFCIILISPCPSVPILNPLYLVIFFLYLHSFLLSEFCINKTILCRLLNEIRVQISIESKTLFNLIKIVTLKAHILGRMKCALGSHRFPNSFQGKNHE